MTKWAMVIDLDKCVACQACSIACRLENNTPVVSSAEAERGRAIRWNDVFPNPINPTEEQGKYPHVRTRYLPRPCMHCENPPCVKVCPVQGTLQDEDGLIRQNYARCIGCRFCTVACPYGARYFNWHNPEWSPEMARCLNPDRVSGQDSLEGPAVRIKGVVEKCTFCIQRLYAAQAQAAAEGRAFRPDEYVPACVQTCTAKARYFGDLDDPESTVAMLSQSQRAFRLLEDVGTRPKVIYLWEG
ncbi:MAG: 4Fe-4S dicluster domain-containing protein [Anaerolineae bacterium]